jgi:hypothetical protein
LSTEDAIGFIRPHKRIGEQVQRSALNADGVRGIVSDRRDVERMACDGRVFKVRHLFLFADPKARRKRGGWRKDLLDFMGRVEKRGSAIKDVSLQMTTRNPEERYKMVAVAIDQLASNGRTSHLAKRRQGRKPLAFTTDELRDAKAIWRNVKDYPTWEDAAAAFPKGFTTARAFRLWKGRK